MNTIYQITKEDLIELAHMLNSVAVQQSKNIEPMYTIEEVSSIVRRDKTTLTRWHNNGILKHNSIGLYSKSDIENFLKK